MQAQNTADIPVSEVQDTQLYGVDDACKKLNISEPTLRRELNAGRLVGRRIGKAKLVFTESELRAYVANLPNWFSESSASQHQSPDATVQQANTSR
jgi:DeoR/GlpR family transcriptional regulator of sugar metabolism